MKQQRPSSRKLISSAAAPVRRSRCARLWSALPEVLEARQLLSATTYQVTTNANTGTGSLQWAIQSVNADPAASGDTIQFLISNTTISPTAANPLPAIVNTVTIDVTGQGIELSGASAGAAANGLDFEAGSAGSILKGLTIDSFGGAGVVLNSGGVTLAHDYIGTDVTGMIAQANHDGVVITSNANRILDDLISGNSFDGIAVSGDANVLQGNLIGTDATGGNALGNSLLGSLAGSAGVMVENATNTMIGGASAADRNVISGNDQDGIAFAGDATGAVNTVENNYIGVDSTGLVALGNFDFGVDLGTTAGLAVSNVLILGNVISANLFSGIGLTAATSNTIQGNLIGTDANGNEPSSDAFGNLGDGITVDRGSAGNLIGGSGSARNVIAANAGEGINFTAVVTGANTIQGNSIGTDGSGLAAAGNSGDGILVQGGTVLIGSNVAAGFGNVLSGNFGSGIHVTGAGAVQAYENLIGVGADGATAVNNIGPGVLLQSSNNVIGSVAAGFGNTIAFNGVTNSPTLHLTTKSAGVAVLGSSSGNAIEGNSIYGNTRLGIDLGNDGVTQNSPGAADGPNDSQQFPVLGTVSGDGATLTVKGSLSGAANSTFTIDFYDNLTGDPLQFGQGQVWAAQAMVSTDGTGNATFTVSFPFAQPVGSANNSRLIWSATATDAAHNTSEFSHDVTETLTLAPSQAASSTAVSSNISSPVFGQTVTYTATVTGPGGTPTGTVQFAVDGVNAGAPVTLAGGLAAFSTGSLTVGTHTITATYSGDLAYLGSAGSLTQAVAPAPSTTALSASTLSSTVGQSVTFTAAVSSTASSVVPTGTVTFMDGSATLGSATLNASGVATLAISSLTAGSHSITAVYGADANYTGSTSNPLTETVSPAPSSISGTVTNDLTGNGFSADDAPLAGVTVNLYAAGGSTPIASTITSSNGTYAFTNVGPGNYFLQEVVPSGWIETGGTAGYSITAAGGTNSTGNNFDDFHDVCDLSKISGVYYVINCGTRVTSLAGNTHEGDQVQVFFTLAGGYTDTLSLVSYTAPESYFSAADASRQVVFDSQSGTFVGGTHSLTITVPNCYYQIDFVCGSVIDHFGPAGSNVFYTPQGRKIDSDNGGSDAQFNGGGSLSGYVYNDVNKDQVDDGTDVGIAGVVITLTGTDSTGRSVHLVRTTAANGSFYFKGLRAGTYTITETQPSGYTSDATNVGLVNGAADGRAVNTAGGAIANIVLAFGANGVSYDFGEVQSSMLWCWS